MQKLTFTHWTNHGLCISFECAQVTWWGSARFHDWSLWFIWFITLLTHCLLLKSSINLCLELHSTLNSNNFQQLHSLNSIIIFYNYWTTGTLIIKWFHTTINTNNIWILLNYYIMIFLQLKLNHDWLNT